jgi:hypothetical protein
MSTLARTMPALPALIAAFLLTLLPACATSASQRSGPIEHPHIVERVAPRDADVPPRIQRGASGYHPDIEAQEEAEAEAYVYLYAFAGAVLIGLVVLIAYGIYGLAELVWEALNQ